MGLSKIVVVLDPPNAPSVTIDGEPLPLGTVKSVQIEQATPHDIPQVILWLNGEVTVNGSALVSVEGSGEPRSYLASIDPRALSEAAAALQGRPDPRNPARYLDSPTEAFLAALDQMVGQ